MPVRVTFSLSRLYLTLCYDVEYVVLKEDVAVRKKSGVVTFPLSVFETADTKEDLEDWLLSQDPDFVKRMRRARQDDLQGKGKDWRLLKKELCIK